MLPSFEYCAAQSVREALALFAQAPGARYYAGGTDLLPQLRLRRRNVARLIDVKRIPELQGVREVGPVGLAIGAATPLAEVARDPRVRDRFPALVQCCEEVGAYPLRHRATLAGNVCNASPAADTAVALLALEAVMVVASPKGPRRVPAAEFFRGPGQTALGEGELLTQVELPAQTAGFEAVYLRLSRRKGMDLATVGVLAARSSEKKPAWRLALAAVAPTPLRVREAEALLEREGKKAFERAAQLASATCRPISDLRGSAEYRREMVGVLARRALATLG